MHHHPLQVCIRPAVQSDAHQMAALDAATASRPWRLEDFAAQGAQPGSLGAVAILSSGETAGFILCRCAADEIEIYRMAVDARCRRRGIGERLLRDTLEQARVRGITSAHLEVASSNRAAIELYRKLGFQQSYVRKNYYAESRDDAVVMRLELSKE